MRSEPGLLPSSRSQLKTQTNSSVGVDYAGLRVRVQVEVNSIPQILHQLSQRLPNQLTHLLLAPPPHSQCPTLPQNWGDGL
jgi:hypothetical protein